MKRTPQKPTVTIGIPAHNEERNIGGLLKSLSTQTAENYAMESITVLCDGCTDSTASIVTSFAEQNPKVTLMDDGMRFWKIERLNLMCQNTQSDILVVFDADIRVSDVHVVEKIVAGLLVSTDIGLVTGLQFPESPKSFWQKFFVTWEMIWIETRRKLNGGISVHNMPGCIFGMKRDFYKDVVIPKEIIAEDEFLFFEARKQGFKFLFLPNAIAYYRLPSTLHEYFVQSARYITTKDRIIEHFGFAVNAEYKVPVREKLRALITVGVQMPIRTICAVLLQISVRFYARFFPLIYRESAWEVATSTK